MQMIRSGLLAESPEDLQTSLKTMKDYYSMFDLEFNIDKTKVMIFSRGKLQKNIIFIMKIKILKLRISTII